MMITPSTFALHPSPAIDQPQAPALVQCNYGFFSLLLPGKDIVSLANSQQLIVSGDTKRQILIHADQQFTVISMNDELVIQPGLCQAHDVIVLLQSHQHYFGLTCHSVEKIAAELGARYQLPKSMRSATQPFGEFFIQHGKILGLTSAKALLDYFTQRGILVPPQDAHLPQVQRGNQ